MLNICYSKHEKTFDKSSIFKEYKSDFIYFFAKIDSILKLKYLPIIIFLCI